MTLAVSGYSVPGGLLQITNGLKVSQSNHKDSCPAGWKIWSPRNKQDWTAVYNAMGNNIKNYPRAPNLIVDVTSGASGCGGCKYYAMRSNVSEQGSWWKTSDGSPWWLRDTPFGEPNGDYWANRYLGISGVDPNNVEITEGNKNAPLFSTAYLCQRTYADFCIASR